MDNGSFEVPPLRADGQGRHISEIQLLQVLRGIEFQKEKQRKRTKQTALVLEQ
jgi:transposase